MNIIILAGGLGTRLRSVIGDLPKPIAPINEKPFLYYLLKKLEKFSVDKVILSLGYGAHQIIDALNGYIFHFDIEYVVEPTQLGTGGGINYALKKTGLTEAIVLNGDTFFDINLQHFFDFYNQTGADVSIAARYVKDAGRYGALEIQGHKLIAFHEKTNQGEGLINAGIYALNARIFKNCIEESNFSFETFLKENIKKISITVQNYDKDFIDIGVPEDYEKSKTLLNQIHTEN